MWVAPGPIVGSLWGPLRLCSLRDCFRKSRWGRELPPMGHTGVGLLGPLILARILIHKMAFQDSNLSVVTTAMLFRAM